MSAGADRPLLALPLGKKRSPDERPASWQFFAVTLGDAERDNRFPDVGLEVFGGSRERALDLTIQFAGSANEGCGDAHISQGMLADLVLGHVDDDDFATALVCGMVVPETRRVVAALTITVSAIKFVSGFGDFLDMYENRFSGGLTRAWFDGNGKLTPLVDPARTDVGSEMAYNDRLYIYIDHFCTARSAIDEDRRVYGTGTELLTHTRQYLMGHLAPLMRAVLARVQRVRDPEGKLSGAMLDALVRRDLRLDLFSADAAMEFYLKNGFSTIPKALQEKVNGFYMVNRMWSAVAEV